MTDRAHWDAVYAARDEDRLTWFETVPHLSLRLIAAHGAPGGSLIDVGGGASRLVDAMLAEGRDVTVLDLAPEALKVSQDRLGAGAERVVWIAADITRFLPRRRWDIWHDRAVFHFLTGRSERDGYARALLAGTAPGSVAIVSTFAEDGPEMCSGLPVRRYSPEALADEIGDLTGGAFDGITHERHTHITPLGREQRFQVSVFRRG